VIHRRKFLNQVAGLAAASQVLPGQPQSVPETMAVAATGDCILTRPVSRLKQPQFLKLVEILRSADCLYGNCEMVLADPDSGGHPMFEGAALSVVSDSKIADELAWLGFDVMGAANNHTWDYGQAGISSTRANLKRAGIAPAGTGLDLQQAAAPSYADTPGGRVALVNCASTFRDYAVAYPSRPDSKGIPGLNPVRLDVRFQLDRAAFEAVTRTAESLQLLGGVGNVIGNSNPAVKISPDKVSMFGNTFVPGPVTEAVSQVIPEDSTRIVESIRQARRNARIVLTSIHAHEAGRDNDTPAKFLPPFARACIDAGADAFFGAGSHVTWGIEIYKGRPICYGLGDFIFQYQTVPALASDVFESYGLDPQMPDSTQASDKIQLTGGVNLWQTIVPVITYQNSGAARMLLYPVTLGMDEPRYQRGTPRLAEGTEAREIIARVARLSEPYGTSIQFRDGIGEVRLIPAR
jgi:poly-gamma-glutamate capsule biosynthesis protein CapA/YwtB (metallophosphatase superfamily)